jgi:hypothetical protein
MKAERVLHPAASKATAEEAAEKEAEKAADTQTNLEQNKEAEGDYNPVNDTEARATFRWPKVKRFGTGSALHEKLKVHQGLPKDQILAAMRLTTKPEEVSGGVLFSNIVIYDHVFYVMTHTAGEVECTTSSGGFNECLCVDFMDIGAVLHG